MEIYVGYEKKLIIEGISECVTSSSRGLEVEIDQVADMLTKEASTLRNDAFMYFGTIYDDTNYQQAIMFYKKFPIEKSEDTKLIQRIDWKQLFTLRKIDDFEHEDLCVLEYRLTPIGFELFQIAAEAKNKWREPSQKTKVINPYFSQDHHNTTNHQQVLF